MSSESVPITITYRPGCRTSMPGQATACPHLVVVPGFTGGRYDGAFTLAHLPTGQFLPSIWAELTPVTARYAAALLASLDWSSADPDLYRGESGRAHQEAWMAAGRAAADLQSCGLDEKELMDGVELAEEQAAAGKPVWRVSTASGGAR